MAVEGVRHHPRKSSSEEVPNRTCDFPVATTATANMRFGPREINLAINRLRSPLDGSRLPI